ncbi:MAG TPA: hypothetical protein VNM37_09795 [Candidatus Dormibacteraeota bacterium]|jgi:hypothetical protein|nr:hypothetical protein [Candidatus Dormibacteraeota bacterium]
MKLAIILDEAQDRFALEYEDTLGRRIRMRLDAGTYVNAVREARSFLGINLDDRDEAGDRWAVP